MTDRRTYVLYFHGTDGAMDPIPVGQVHAPCAEQALELFADRALETESSVCVDGVWCCCSCGATDPTAPQHPACCQTQFTVTARGVVTAVTPLN